MKDIKDLLKDYKYAPFQLKDLEISRLINKDNEEVEKLKRSIEAKVSIVDDALSKLSEKHYKIIMLKNVDINSPTWEEASNKMNYSSSYCKALHRKALEQLEDVM